MPSHSVNKPIQRSLLWSGTVDTKPLALKRARMGRSHQIYNPSIPDQKAFAQQLSMSFPDEPLRGPLLLDIQFIFGRPKTHLSKNEEKFLLPKAPVEHTAKPDIDNLVKFYLDALNGHVYVDDSQFIQLIAGKRYIAHADEQEAVHINIYDASSQDDPNSTNSIISTTMKTMKNIKPGKHASTHEKTLEQVITVDDEDDV